MKETSSLNNEGNSSTPSEDIAPSPKRLNQKRTPQASAAIPTRKSTRNRQLTLTNALGNPILINTINDASQKTKTPLQFEIDSPPDKPETENNPSLKPLIQEMGFTEKTPKYQACVRFLKAISPKNKQKQNEIVDLTSPTESTIDMNDKDILFVRVKEVTEEATEEKQDEEMHEDEEHENNMEDDNNNESGKIPTEN